MKTSDITRRDFLNSMGIGLAGTQFHSSPINKTVDAKITVLFQGDSITDGNRGRTADPNHIMGHGYAFAIAAKLGAAYPGRHLTFLNKGNSGDTAAMLQARWKADALEFTPDVISLLVGINDVLYRINSNDRATGDGFERNFRKIMDDTRHALPATTMVVGIPFILPVGRVLDNPARWSEELAAVQQSIRKITADYGAIVVDFQKSFTAALTRAPADYWIWDGIHPTVSGHGLMGEHWLHDVGAVIPALQIG